jgi:hypothetical protein
VSAKPRPEGFALQLKSTRPLETLWQKKDTVDKINAKIQTGQKLTLAEFEFMAAGDFRAHFAPSDSAENEKCKMHNVQCSMKENPRIAQIHAAVIEAACDLATCSDNTPTQLLALQKLADFPARAHYREHKTHMDLHRKEMAEHREHIANERLAISRRLATIREEELALKKSKPAGSSANGLFKPWSPEELPARQAEVEAAIQKDPLLRQIGLPPQDFRTPAHNPDPTPTLSQTESLTPTSAEESAPSLTSDFQSAEAALDELTASPFSPLNTPRGAPDSKCQMKNAQCSMLNAQ